MRKPRRSVCNPHLWQWCPPATQAVGRVPRSALRVAFVLGNNRTRTTHDKYIPVNACLSSQEATRHQPSAGRHPRHGHHHTQSLQRTREILAFLLFPLAGRQDGYDALHQAPCMRHGESFPVPGSRRHRSSPRNAAVRPELTPLTESHRPSLSVRGHGRPQFFSETYLLVAFTLAEPQKACPFRTWKDPLTT